MKNYMQAMAKVVNGSDPHALARSGDTGFDPQFVSVYRNNSVCALSEVLSANYMSVLDLVGEDFFTSLVTSYIEKYPARQRTLISYGKDFSKTVEKTKSKHRLPYLGDFARLDRAWTLAHVAADTPALPIATLTQMAEQGVDLSDVKLTLMPGVKLLKLKWSVFDIWEKLRDEQKLESAIEIDKTTQYVLVWRYENAVSYRLLQQSEYNFLDSIEHGEPLGTAMNNAIVSFPANAPEQDFTALLPNAVGADLFRAL